MPRSMPLSLRQSGFGMIEVLVTLIILLVGLLGLAGLMVQSQRSEFESYQRVQALILLQDISGRINANRAAASCYKLTNAASGSPYLGTAATATPACTQTAIQSLYPDMTAAMATLAATTAVADMNTWNQALLGAAEKSSGGNNIGAMTDARGCISYDATAELPQLNSQTGLATGATLSGTGIYTLSIAWKGIGETFANTNNLCGKGNYDLETKRRVASLTLRIASLE